MCCSFVSVLMWRCVVKNAGVVCVVPGVNSFGRCHVLYVDAEKKSFLVWHGNRQKRCALECT